jgi:transcriptional regulator with XRE-family HTH domain
MAKEEASLNLAEDLRYVGEVLRHARSSRGLSLRELSVDSGIAYPNISIIENGNCSVKISTLSKLFEAMDMTIRDAVVKYEMFNE